jgi:superfamily II DNA or RNA helicase
MVKIRESPTQLLLQGSQLELQQIDQHFRYKPASYWRSDSYQIWSRHQKNIAAAQVAGNEIKAQQLALQKVGWDGFKHPLKFRSPTEAVILRGHLPDLLSLSMELDLQFDTSKVLPNPFARIVEDDIPDDLLAAELNEEQWALQKSCIYEWLVHGIGRNHVTVSGGKTAMFCSVAAAIKLRFPQARFLYFTPTERLIKQVYGEATRFLPDWDITMFGGPGRDDTGKDMVVVTAQILNSRFKALYHSGWFKSFFGLLIDEVHLAGSPSMKKILLACSAYFRFGASDTTREDDPERSSILTGLCGPIYGHIETSELIDLDRVATPTLKIISVPGWRNRFVDLSNEPAENCKAWVFAEDGWQTGIYKGPVYELDENGDHRINWRGEKVKQPGLHLIQVGGKEFQVESRWCLLERKQDQAIILFKERNDIIGKWAKHYSDAGKPVLVVATRTLHILILQAVLQKYIAPENIRILYSIHSSAQRDETFEWFKATPGAVLISSIVKIGVSINQIKAMIVADFVADWEMMRQLIGRAIRKKEDVNEAEIVIFKELQHSSYAAVNRKLITKLKTIQGFKFEEVEENVVS